MSERDPWKLPSDHDLPPEKDPNMIVHTDSVTGEKTITRLAQVEGGYPVECGACGQPGHLVASDESGFRVTHPGQLPAVCTVPHLPPDGVLELPVEISEN